MLPGFQHAGAGGQSAVPRCLLTLLREKMVPLLRTLAAVRGLPLPHAHGFIAILYLLVHLWSPAQACRNCLTRHSLPAPFADNPAPTLVQRLQTFVKRFWILLLGAGLSLLLAALAALAFFTASSGSSSGSYVRSQDFALRRTESTQVMSMADHTYRGASGFLPQPRASARHTTLADSVNRAPLARCCLLFPSQPLYLPRIESSAGGLFIACVFASSL